MMYLYIGEYDDTWQSSVSPTLEQIEKIIDNELMVYKYSIGSSLFEMCTPIDKEDVDNWSVVDQQ